MKPKEIISQLIRAEFDKNKNYWQESRRKNLIETAEYYQLDCVTEMINDN